jgi:hypothetical protein
MGLQILWWDRGQIVTVCYGPGSEGGQGASNGSIVVDSAAAACHGSLERRAHRSSTLQSHLQPLFIVELTTNTGRASLHALTFAPS